MNLKEYPNINRNMNSQVNVVRLEMISSIEERFKYLFKGDCYSKAVMLDPKTKGNKWFSERRKTRTLDLLKIELSGLGRSPIDQPPAVKPSKNPLYDQIFGGSGQILSTELEKWILEPACPKETPSRGYFGDRPEYKGIGKLYRIYCSTPATAVSVEQLWSEAGHLTQRRRSCLSSHLLKERLLNRKPQEKY